MKGVSAKLFCFSCHYGCNLSPIRIAYPPHRGSPPTAQCSQYLNCYHNIITTAFYIDGYAYYTDYRPAPTMPILSIIFHCQSAIKLINVSIGYS